MELKYILGILLIVFVASVLFVDYNKNIIDLKDMLSVIVIYFFLLVGILVLT